ncbi:MAG TPA: hypothetical protein VMS37_32450 [Verrucomicrobiae bacterium]|nr:hypothetical protein [Verrucomicrobiae bacterium]
MRRLTIGTKIWLACGLMGLCGAAIGAIALAGVSRLNTATQQLGSKALPSTYLAGRPIAGSIPSAS